MKLVWWLFDVYVTFDNLPVKGALLTWSLRTKGMYVLKADPGSARRARAPRFEIFWGFVFVNFDYLTRIYFDFSQYTMFTICILFTTLAPKT